METWTPIPEYEDYTVSNLGRVRGPRSLLKPQRSGSSGHAKVSLRGTQRKVHILVAEAYLGPRNGKIVDHMDGDPTNNRADNLRYLTQAENIMFGGPAYRVLCQEYGQSVADQMIRDYTN